MANNILEPFYLDLVQRETAYREQLRQQQLEQEQQLTSNPPAERPEPEPCSSPRRGEAVSDHDPSRSPRTGEAVLAAQLAGTS